MTAQTHCPKGHEYPAGRRRCLICRREEDRAYRAAHREERNQANREWRARRTTRTDDAEAFWSKVAKGDGCWEWQGKRGRSISSAYGVFRGAGAHRVRAQLATGATKAQLARDYAVVVPTIADIATGRTWRNLP